MTTVDETETTARTARLRIASTRMYAETVATQPRRVDKITDEAGGVVGFLEYAAIAETAADGVRVTHYGWRARGCSRCALSTKSAAARRLVSA